MSDIIISIDPSLESSGLCILQDGSLHHYECIVPYPLKNLERLHSNYLDYCRVFSTYRDIKCISFECQVPQMRYNYNSGSIIPLAENIGVLKLAIATKALVNNPELIVLAIPPGDIKKYATGNSKATKEDMINAVSTRPLNKIKKNIPAYSVNDVADAYHLAMMTHKLLKEGTYDKYVYENFKKEGVSIE